ncbi:MAG: hypothetical protein RBS82_00505, partial [Syntrophales bacterium]|nr:hypothetical protein [Syntrophales bacterium]
MIHQCPAQNHKNERIVQYSCCQVFAFENFGRALAFVFIFTFMLLLFRIDSGSAGNLSSFAKPFLNYFPGEKQKKFSTDISTYQMCYRRYGDFFIFIKNEHKAARLLIADIVLELEERGMPEDLDDLEIRKIIYEASKKAAISDTIHSHLRKRLKQEIADTLNRVGGGAF